MKIQWKPRSFAELTSMWNEYWKHVEFKEQPLSEIELEDYIQKVKSLYVNGGIIIKCFDIPYSVVIDFYFHRLTQHFDKTTFFINLFSSASIKKAIPEFKLNEGLLYIPRFKLDNSFNDINGVIEVFKNVLVFGGAYNSLRNSEELANNLSECFCKKLFEEDFNNIIAFSAHECWNEWFYDVAWDYSWVIINKKDFKLWIIGITDTD